MTWGRMMPDKLARLTQPLHITFKTDSTGGFVGIIEILQSVQGAHTISAQTQQQIRRQIHSVMPHVFMYPARA